MSSKREPNLIESDDGKEFVNKIFTDLFNKNYIKRYSRYTSLRTVCAERFNRTIRYFLKRPVFEKGDCNWIDFLSVITKQNTKRVHISTEFPAIQASLKKEQRACLP